MGLFKFPEGINNRFPYQAYYPKIILGATAGFVTGYTSLKLGKIAALAIGGGIIMMHLASKGGYINFDCLVFSKKLNAASESFVAVMNEENLKDLAPPADGVNEYKPLMAATGADYLDGAEKKGKKKRLLTWANKVFGNSSAFYGAYAIGYAFTMRLP